MTESDPFILYVGLPLFVLGWIVLNLRLKTIWRDGVPYAKHNFDRGSPSWRAWVRASVAFGWSFGLGIILVMVAMSLPQDHAATTLIGQAGALIWLASILLGFVVAMFNRPKVVVPPPYRPGAIVEWAVRRRRRRSSDLTRRTR